MSVSFHHCNGLSLLEKRFQGIRHLPVVRTLKRLLKALSLLSGLAAVFLALAFLAFTSPTPMRTRRRSDSTIL